MTNRVLKVLCKIAASTQNVDEGLAEAEEQAMEPQSVTEAQARGKSAESARVERQTPAEEQARQSLENQKNIGIRRASEDVDAPYKLVGRAARSSAAVRSKLARYSKGVLGRNRG